MRVCVPVLGRYPHHLGGHVHTHLAGLVALAGCGFQPVPSAIDAPVIVPADVSHVIDAPVQPPLDAPPDAFAGAVVRVDVRGPAVTGIDHPGVWAADLGVCSGSSTLSVTDDINATSDDALFQTAAAGNLLHCTVGVPAGTYDVTLLFAEIELGAGCARAASTRVFSVELEGSVVAPAIDLESEGAGCAVAGGPGHPIARSFTIAVIDGALDIVLAKQGVSEAAVLSAIEAIQVAP